ncbi:EamA family transporter [Candidatus Woesearchaeota archaeon]|nr:EamA family transporter [Candidatus Woesearchaeota archaeon]
MTTELWAIGLVLAGVLYGSFGSLLFKQGSEHISLDPIKLLKNWRLILGTFVYGTSAIIFVIALRGGELSVLYPMVATVYIWVSIWSMLFLKEKMNFIKWAGIFLIILGVTFVGIGGG